MVSAVANGYENTVSSILFIDVPSSLSLICSGFQKVKISSNIVSFLKYGIYVVQLHAFSLCYDQEALTRLNGNSRRASKQCIALID